MFGDNSPLKVRSISKELSKQFMDFGIKNVMSNHIESVKQSFKQINLGQAYLQSKQSESKPNKK